MVKVSLVTSFNGHWVDSRVTRPHLTAGTLTAASAAAAAAVWAAAPEEATQVSIFFTARRHASAIYVPLSCVCLTICLSVISQYSIETAKRRITQTTPQFSDGKDLRKTQTGV